jgi:hypothetical protein
MICPVVPSITIMAGLDKVGTFKSSSNTAGIDSGAKAASAGAIESIRARQVTNTLLSNNIGWLITEQMQ